MWEGEIRKGYTVRTLFNQRTDSKMLEVTQLKTSDCSHWRRKDTLRSIQSAEHKAYNPLLSVLLFLLFNL